MQFRPLSSPDVGMSAAFNWILSSSFHPPHYVYSTGIDFSSPPYMHGNLRIFTHPHTHLCRHVDPPRPRRLVKAKTLPQTKINSIYKAQISKST